MPIQVTCPSCSGKFNAPDSAVGKKAKCPKCGGIIDITAPAPPPVDDIVDAEEAQPRPFDDDDFDVEPPAALPTTQGRKPCPMCGEMISSDAVKCRFCGEVFDPVLRATEKKKAKGGPDDEDLSVVEWILAILCSGIGCILGIVYMIQGKPKGKKLFLVSICVQVFWALVRVAIMAARH